MCCCWTHSTSHGPPQNIAQTSYVVPRLEALMMGTSDLTNDLHALHTPDRSPLLYSLSKCVVAARAFRLRVIDGVFLDLNDAEVGAVCVFACVVFFCFGVVGGLPSKYIKANMECL